MAKVKKKVVKKAKKKAKKSEKQTFLKKVMNIYNELETQLSKIRQSNFFLSCDTYTLDKDLPNLYKELEKTIKLIKAAELRCGKLMDILEIPYKKRS